MSSGRVFVAPPCRSLSVCYGSPESIRTLTGDAALLAEVDTALFTAAALEMEAPHDCTPHFWLNWVCMRSMDADTGENAGFAGGGEVCPCADVLDCPLGVQHDG